MPDKILIVDDDIETLRLVGIMLQRQGYQIVAANSGKQAITMTSTDHPDLILLDIMMPEMDGYEVARQLRANPDTAGIPILMFTAKGQVEDKITGYEAGADDYLTKPTHPAELNAHIKALLSRTAKSHPATSAVERGHVVGVLAAKGGIGTSTVALNLAVALGAKEKSNVIAAEFRPGCGGWGLELGYVNPEGLRNLLRLKLSEITTSAVEKELISSATGIRLLLSTYQPRDVEAVKATDHFEAILNAIAALASISVIDLGLNMFPEGGSLIEQMNEVVVVVDPVPTSVSRTKALLDDLALKGFGKAKLLTLAMVNRVRSDTLLTWSQVQEELCIPVSVVIPPAPEQAYQAAMRFIPTSILQPDSIDSQQYKKLAEIIAQHANRW